jgi:hypothetical protein
MKTNAIALIALIAAITTALTTMGASASDTGPTLPAELPTSISSPANGMVPYQNSIGQARFIDTWSHRFVDAHGCIRNVFIRQFFDCYGNPTHWVRIVR